MQPTSLGPNLTGATMSPAAVQAMVQATEELSPFDVIDTSQMEAQKAVYATESDAVGSVPVPVSVKGVLKSGIAKVKGGHPTLFLDKLGERLAYERTGTRLYDALILKYQAAQQLAGDPLPSLQLMSDEDAPSVGSETPAETLLRIRNEELAHFRMLSEAITAMGGDPTSQTPCADVSAMQSMGFMQVLNDPRTTLGQCLNAMLAVELADNAGWELLASLADDAGEDALAAQFLSALAQEQQHLTIVKAWLTSILYEDPQPSVV